MGTEMAPNGEGREAPKLSSVSAARTFAECPERYRRSYVERLQLKRKPLHLNLGSWVHSWLENYYSGGDTATCVNAICEEAEKTIVTEADASKIAVALGMLRGLAAAYPLWAQPKDTWDVKAVEKVGEWGGLNYRIDMVVEAKDERAGLWVVEHKTHAMGYGDGYQETASYAIQPTAYAASQGAVGIVYNLLGKPALRQKQRESREEFISRIEQDYLNRLDEYFTRHWVWIPDAEKTAVARLKGSQAMLDAVAKDAEYPRNESSCLTFGRCAFLPLCQRYAGAEEMYEERPVHEPEVKSE